MSESPKELTSTEMNYRKKHSQMVHAELSNRLLYAQCLMLEMQIEAVNAQNEMQEDTDNPEVGPSIIKP